MNLCSGGATVSLVAELTGLVDTGTRSGFRTQGRSARSENIIDIIRTSLKEAAARLKMFQSNCYDDFNSMM
jgi:hypothetical protein